MKQQYILALQANHKKAEAALVYGNKLLDKKIIDGDKVSTMLALSIKELMEQNKVSLEELSAIAIDQGPGSFTTVKVIATTANALSFALPAKIFGTSGIDTTVQHFAKQKDLSHFDIVFGAINAYSNEVFMSAWNKNLNKLTYQNVCITLEKNLELIQEACKENKVLLVGEAINLYNPEELSSITNLTVETSEPESLAYEIAQKCLQNIGSPGALKKFISPQYIKSGFRSKAKLS